MSGTTSARVRYCDVWVCVSCYWAHHYGRTEHDGAWYAGDDDSPCDCEPLTTLDTWGPEFYITDHACTSEDHNGDVDSETPCTFCGEVLDGKDTYSSRPCQTCQQWRAGDRYRMAVWGPDDIEHVQGPDDVDTDAWRTADIGNPDVTL